MASVVSPESHFYPYLPRWSACTEDLVAHRVQRRTLQPVKAARDGTDPRQRVAILTQVGLGLPHGAEAAIPRT